MGRSPAGAAPKKGTTPRRGARTRAENRAPRPAQAKPAHNFAAIRCEPGSECDSHWCTRRAGWPLPAGSAADFSRENAARRGRGSLARTVRCKRGDSNQTIPMAGSSAPITLLGTASPFRQALALARKVAPTGASVLITGESGSGKELVAQFIHYHSTRSSRPFVAVNCAALPEGLLESEMFGHRKGAFTGATRDKPGLVETANGGTLFLDELIEMPKPVQAKLLRVIQDGVVRRVGSETTDAVVDVRYIAATNRSPEAAIRAGEMRVDLYYRLGVVPIRVPPLRERPEDIPLLAEHFLSTHWIRHRSTEGPMPKLTAAALRTLCAYPWPGNVRELQNLIEHVAVLLEPGAGVQPQDLPLPGASTNLTRPGPLPDSLLDDRYLAARGRTIAQFERQYLTWLLCRAGGSVFKAARVAGVNRATLYRMMKRHGLQGGGPRLRPLVAREPAPAPSIPIAAARNGTASFAASA